MSVDKVDILRLNLLQRFRGKGKAGAVAHKLCGVDTRESNDLVGVNAVVRAGIIRRCNGGVAVLLLNY